MLSFSLFTLAVATLSTKDENRINAISSVENLDLVTGVDASHSKVLGTPDPIKNLLLKSETHAFSADKSGILSMILDPVSKTSTSKRTCKFEADHTIYDMTLSKNGNVYLWRIQVQPVHPAIILPLTLIPITFL
ncbi:hypothetical protein DSO57_1019784 [Entomophthora muscae]|uniref:Uncharacterized protein n=1 Tax=Entomophthora muscae TaxID=34485 RepID=A0ACC2UD93_9FUNG|nr:hypothetical protein DSO57_1019784 [Entomophthora muscae]